MAPDKVARYPPKLFSIYSEAMVSGVNEGLRVGGHLIKAVRFEDE